MCAAPPSALFCWLLEPVSRMDEANFTDPAYNIEKTGEDHYRITMAAASFDDSELGVTQQENVLLIRGKALEEDTGKTFLHRRHCSTGL